MTRHGHHHHHHQGGGGIQHTAGAVLLGAAAAAAAANHYASQHHDNNNNNRRRDVILVQHPLPPPSHAPTIDPTHHPPYLHVVRSGQHSMLVLNDGSHQRPPGWRLRGHCELCLTRFGLFARRHHCRNCGRSVCWRHSTHRTPLPHYGFHNYVRVCSDCYPVLLDAYRTGRPYTLAMLQQRIQHQQQLGAAPSNPYAGSDNLASYVRPPATTTAQGAAPLYAPVATYTTTASSTNNSGGFAPPRPSADLPRAELIYDGSAHAAYAPPTVPTAPPAGEGGGDASQQQDLLYRPASGTARW